MTNTIDHEINEQKSDKENSEREALKVKYKTATVQPIKEMNEAELKQKISKETINSTLQSIRANMFNIRYWLGH